MAPSPQRALMGKPAVEGVERPVELAHGPLQQRSLPKSQVSGKVRSTRLAGHDGRSQRPPRSHHAGAHPAAVCPRERRSDEQPADGDRQIPRRPPAGDGRRRPCELLLDRLKLAAVIRPSNPHADTIGPPHTVSQPGPHRDAAAHRGQGEEAVAETIGRRTPHVGAIGLALRREAQFGSSSKMAGRHLPGA
jgi:hypothetical protein